jgi:hypothetical protein
MLQQWISAFALALAGFLAFDPQPARAQTPSLGGYGASSSMTQAGMGGSGPIIPYGGGLSGFMPYRMGGAGTGLSFSSRNSSTVGTGRSAFRLSSMTGGMGMSSSAFGQSLGRGTAGSLFSPGLGAGMGRSMDSGSQSVMPPNFGYPFYQPPSLLPLSSTGVGMSSM